VSPEEEPIENPVRKLVFTLHEADSRLNFELFYGHEFSIIDNARVFVSPEKITDEEFFKVIKGIMLACQKLLEKYEKEES
jgi:hypothetical protein